MNLYVKSLKKHWTFEYEELHAEELSPEPFIELAYEFLKLDYPDLIKDEIKQAGHGAANLNNTFVQDIRFSYRDATIEYWEDGSLQRVGYEVDYDEYYDQGKLEILKKSDVETMVSMAEDYLLAHNIEGYEVNQVGDNRLGRVWIEFREKGEIKEQYENDIYGCC